MLQSWIQVCGKSSYSSFFRIFYWDLNPLSKVNIVYAFCMKCYKGEREVDAPESGHLVCRVRSLTGVCFKKRQRVSELPIGARGMKF